MGLAFREAYESAEHFCRRYAATRPAAGFLKTILLRRIGSSPMAGLVTARGMLERADQASLEMNEIDDLERLPSAVSPLGATMWPSTTASARVNVTLKSIMRM